MQKKKMLYNIVSGFGGQLIVLVFGLILPRIMLVNYGSDVNGVTNTITQIFAYMALLEAGIGQATKNALYKPIAEDDRGGISYVMSVSRAYYRKMTAFYALGVVAMSFLLPMVLKSQLDGKVVFLIVLLEGLSGVIPFYFFQSLTVLLDTEGKGYINANMNLLSKVFGYIAKIVLAQLGVSIVFLQLAYFLISLLKMLFYRWYFRKNYGWVEYVKTKKADVLKDRNSYIVSELAWTVFSSTDMIILSAFVSTQMSSVYSVYNMVFQNLSVLLNSVYKITIFPLGKAFVQDKKQYTKLHDTFNSAFMGTMTALMCVTYLLIIPFVRLYTTGITDVNYIWDDLPVMFCLVQLLSWGRYVAGNLTAVAGYASVTAKISIVEAAANIILSVLLVPKFGIVGVIAATACSLPLKYISLTYLADVKILGRKMWKSLTIFFANIAVFAVVMLVEKVLDLRIDSYLQFAGCGVVLTVVVFAVVGAVNALVNPDLLRGIKQAVGSRTKRL